MRRDADQRVRRQHAAHDLDRHRASAQVDAVCADRDRDVDPIVHQEEGARPRRQRAQALGQDEQRAAGEVLVAQLHRGQTGVERARDDVDEVAPSGGVAIGDEDERRRVSG